MSRFDIYMQDEYNKSYKLDVYDDLVNEEKSFSKKELNDIVNKYKKCLKK